MIFLRMSQRYGVALFAFLSCLILSCSPANEKDKASLWPQITRDSKPWTRWWWHGNAVTKEGITAEMEAYKKAGIGGLEITPIYGVYGEEENFVDFLSPEWMVLLTHVLAEAERLDMGIDMATGTGWPFGGPWVRNADACKNLQHRVFEMKGGSKLAEKVEFIQQPYLRLVGNNIYRGNMRVLNTDDTSLKDLIDPIGDSPDLQKLAIDQVQFEKRIPLQCLVGYGSKGEIIDLTDAVDAEGNLNWTAPDGNWRLYAVFEGFHGKMVERAGPGGEGNVIDHFSDTALENYLSHFDSAFQGTDIRYLRAFFNDSYEVDDARGAADFTPALFGEFQKRRGYDLKKELPALFGDDDEDKNKRVLCDYRETLSELLLEKFTVRWKEWAHRHGALVRNQAHGSPSNILDLYATVDIPEIEGVEPLRFKMASSSGNVSGKKLVSAEAATWLNEHFESSLGDVKQTLDNFMLHGVNHLVYHGTCYSPPGDSWPGRLFYAAVHLNPRNPQWKDFHALNQYVARCQSFLQNTSPDNDILLYYPIYDRFSAPGPEMVEHFDGIGGFSGSGFEETAEYLLQKGFAFDYISDRQILETHTENNLLETSGGGSYKVIVVPACHYMPLQTLEKLYSLVQQGGQVLFENKALLSVNGYGDLSARQEQFRSLLAKFSEATNDSLQGSLKVAGVPRESMVDGGIDYVRKRNAAGGKLYFVRNSNPGFFEGWLRLSGVDGDVMLFDPMTGKLGVATTRVRQGVTEVFVQLEPSESLIVEESRVGNADRFPYREKDGEPVILTGRWKVTFESGGPKLPPAFERDSLLFWTDLSDPSYGDFSGTGTYTLSFKKPGSHDGRWLMELDSVKGTAEVILNGKVLATLIGPVYKAEIDGELLNDENTLSIRVSNLMANRIAYLDRNNIFWKKFYNINFAARKRENLRNNIFDASQWQPKPSGISGALKLYSLK